MNLGTSYGIGPHPLLWAGSGAARGNITASFTANCLSARVIFILHQTAVGILLTLMNFMTWLRALTWSYSGQLTQMAIYPFCGGITSVEWVSGFGPKEGMSHC